jgi:hypothetical protein
MTTLFERYYKKAKGAYLPVSADIAGRYLEAVEAKYRKLTTKALVDQVEQDGSQGPVAPCFTWDKDDAIHKLHEYEARLLMCAVEVVIRNPEDDSTITAQPVRAFVNVRDNRKIYESGEYHSIIEVLSDDKLRVRVLEQAHKELELWHHRYSQLEEAERVWKLWSGSSPQKPKPQSNSSSGRKKAV